MFKAHEKLRDAADERAVVNPDESNETISQVVVDDIHQVVVQRARMPLTANIINIPNEKKRRERGRGRRVR